MKTKKNCLCMVCIMVASLFLGMLPGVVTTAEAGVFLPPMEERVRVPPCRIDVAPKETLLENLRNEKSTILDTTSINNFDTRICTQQINSSETVVEVAADAKAVDPRYVQSIILDTTQINSLKTGVEAIGSEDSECGEKTARQAMVKKGLTHVTYSIRLRFEPTKAEDTIEISLNKAEVEFLGNLRNEKSIILDNTSINNFDTITEANALISGDPRDVRLIELDTTQINSLETKIEN